ncbi:hypothetical protein AF335_08505 [Streptomyces eurocidicus]|uniref:Regulatory protein n=1 Tax=Streptomyces eurocidicus TaxID=66423 RepID=A0A2N8P1D9_STREU|nr:hypothetical protein [Streptomyces eurocidicus]MBB5122067.1 hypothetical protein [Streptomyces eurocidicus]MBF6055400.1 hypothetical protein [Streptomyces eurocidicus]PNE34825.1 hypothetical protein AF335_08505 [Streptomyces eurocidicus]
MPDAQLEPDGIKEQYAFKVAADLEHNTKEQERIGAEVTALEERLRALRRDHTLLVGVQQALGEENAAAPVSQEPSGKAALPKPRSAEAEPKQARGRKTTTAKVPATKVPATKATTLKRAAAKTTAAKSGKNSAKSTAVTADTEPVKTGVVKAEPVKTEPTETRSAVKTDKADAKAAGPTLVSLVREVLGRQSEPRSAAEIAAAVAEARPDRTIKPTVVRTTVEGLVAKGQARRTKQGTSVFYAAPDDEPAARNEPATTAGPTGGGEPATA